MRHCEEGKDMGRGRKVDGDNQGMMYENHGEPH